MSADVSVLAITGPRGLTDFVRRTLCDHDRLDPAQSPLYQSILTRSGRACGLLFHVEGPRHLRTSALWAEEEHRIIFYDSKGLRFLDVRLSESPTLEEVIHP